MWKHYSVKIIPCQPSYFADSYKLEILSEKQMEYALEYLTFIQLVHDCKI